LSTNEGRPPPLLSEAQQRKPEEGEVPRDERKEEREKQGRALNCATH